MTLRALIEAVGEHPRHAILEEMQARGWRDTDLIKGMDPETALAALLYVYVEAAEQVRAGDGVLAALERRFGVSDGFLHLLDAGYRSAILKAMEARDA